MSDDQLFAMALIHNSKLDIRKSRYKGYGRHLDNTEVIVNVSCVPSSCSGRSNSKVKFPYYPLRSQNRKLLKVMDPSNPPFEPLSNFTTRVHSRQFIIEEGQKFRKDELLLESYTSLLFTKATPMAKQNSLDQLSLYHTNRDSKV